MADVCSTSAVKRVEHIYAIRFFQGISESSTFVGTHYILGAYVHVPLISQPVNLANLFNPWYTGGINQAS